MLRRFSLAVVLGVLFLGMAVPVFAATHTVFNRTNTFATGMPVLVGLVSGHEYRVSVSSPSKRSFTINGYENYSFVQRKAMFERTASVTKRGTTPWSFVLKQPRTGALSQWILGLQVQLTRGRGISVQVSDLGMRK